MNFRRFPPAHEQQKRSVIAQQGLSAQAFMHAQLAQHLQIEHAHIETTQPILQQLGWRWLGNSRSRRRRLCDAPGAHTAHMDTR